MTTNPKDISAQKAIEGRKGSRPTTEVQEVTLVSLTLRRGQQCQLSIEKVAQGRCCIDIETDPVRDDRIAINLSIHSGRESIHREGEVDHAVKSPAVHEDIGESVSNIVGVGQQVGFINQHSFSGNQVISDQLKEQFKNWAQLQNYNSGLAGLNPRYDALSKESSEDAA